MGFDLVKKNKYKKVLKKDGSSCGEYILIVSKIQVGLSRQIAKVQVKI